MPAASAHFIPGFDAKQLLGRKGTSSLDRRTAMGLVACGEALEDGRVQVNEESRHRIGVVLGTTWGSLKSMSDYTRETLIEQRPYLVNAALFPNTVMNCTAGQVAIRYGLKGVNATVAGGPMAMIAALRWAQNALARNYADTLLVGCVEELTPHAAWATRCGETGDTAAGEAAGVFAVERAGGARAGAVAEILAIATGFCPGGRAGGKLEAALAACIRRVLAEADADPQDVWAVATSRSGVADADRYEAAALDAVFERTRPERVAVRPRFGECQSASGALQLAALLALHRAEPKYNGRLSLIVSQTPEAGFGAVVVRGPRHDRPKLASARWW